MIVRYINSIALKIEIFSHSINLTNKNPLMSSSISLIIVE
ncbi:hypothetical protein EMUCRT_0467 [Ehrlichia cf. muris str. EmCRT]|uniref:Uncharacterized protein n=1 Tax=Ehrlichia cf. muris str. EmCRT TaxID=1359167 RepID=A0A0F3NBQ0_9RICK|nr:hypothetical protein EMUCRT_0467 [Ehrlichia cf. muris str. EmCRT]